MKYAITTSIGGNSQGEVFYVHYVLRCRDGLLMAMTRHHHIAETLMNTLEFLEGCSSEPILDKPVEDSYGPD